MWNFSLKKLVTKSWKSEENFFLTKTLIVGLYFSDKVYVITKKLRFFKRDFSLITSSFEHCNDKFVANEKIKDTLENESDIIVFNDM